MRKTAITLGFLLCFVLHSIADDRPVDVKILRERTFTGTALYGFMNGGSDLYYEYGFVELKVLDVDYNGKRYSVELYKMGSPEDAFGIYSIHSFGFHTRDTIIDFCNFSKYQMQAVVGDIYASVVYDSPVQSINLKAVEILHLLDVVDGKKAEIPAEVLSVADGVTGNVKMMRGPLSVMNGASEVAEHTKNVGEFVLWCVTQKTEGNRIAYLYTANDPVAVFHY